MVLLYFSERFIAKASSQLCSEWNGQEQTRDPLSAALHAPSTTVQRDRKMCGKRQRSLLACLQCRLFLHLGTAGSKPITHRCLSNEVSSKWPKMTKPTMNSTRPEASLACRSSRRRPLAALQATSLICLRQQHQERRILPKPQCSKTLVQHGSQPLERIQSHHQNFGKTE